MSKSFEPIGPGVYQDVYAHYKYAPAVRIGDAVHVSGLIGLDPDHRVPESYEAQLANIFTLMEVILAESGASLADVFSLTSYHVGDLGAQMPGFIEAQAARLGEPHPAWTAVGVTQLALPGALVEVAAVAHRPR